MCTGYSVHFVCKIYGRKMLAALVYIDANLDELFFKWLFLLLNEKESFEHLLKVIVHFIEINSIAYRNLINKLFEMNNLDTILVNELLAFISK